jgi:hypothetical protein
MARDLVRKTAVFFSITALVQFLMGAGLTREQITAFLSTDAASST